METMEIYRHPLRIDCPVEEGPFKNFYTLAKAQPAHTKRRYTFTPFDSLDYLQSSYNTSRYSDIEGKELIKNEQSEEEDITEYPTSWKLASIVVSVCLAVFCMALDNTIIATAIPKISDDFKALEDVAWYGSAYLLTTCAFQLFFGRLYTFFDMKTVFLCTVGIFEFGSLICGAAPSSMVLIIGRAIAGVGSAGIFSGGILIVAHIVPLHKRPMYTGLAGSMYGIASVAGPLLGGVFTDRLSWRWCFYINLPIGAIAIACFILCFKSPDRKTNTTLSLKAKLIKLELVYSTPTIQRPDRTNNSLIAFLAYSLPGTVVFIPAVVCLLLALQWGGSRYPWNDGRVIGLFVVCLILTIAFIGIQRWQQENATVPPRIFLQRNVAAAAWFAFAAGGAFFILMYFVPIWFQAIKGVSAIQSGIYSLPLVLSTALFSVLSGVGVTLLGYYTPWMLAGSICASIGCGLLSTFQVDTVAARWISFQILVGAGFGMGIQNPLIVVQTVLPNRDIPTGTALMMFAQTLGGSIFITVAENVFLNELTKNIRGFLPTFQVSLLFQTGAMTFRTAVPKEYLPIVIYCYNKALDQTFYVSTAMAALSILGAVFIQWKSVKGKFVMGGV